MTRRAVALLLLALALPAAAFLAAPAGAQVPPLPGAGPGSSQARITMELQDPGVALVPARPYALTVTVHYIYGPGAAVPPDQDIAPAGRVCGTIGVANPPPWATVTVLQPDVCFIINPNQSVGGTTVTNDTALVEINVTTEAPGLEPYNFTVTASTPATGTLTEASGEVSRIITTGYVGKIQVRGPEASVVQGGKANQVPVTITNLGNGPIEVRFRNATVPQGMRFTLPERVVLNAPGEERTAFLTLHAPWTGPVRGQVELVTESSHPSRPELIGDEPRVRFDVQGKAAVPGVEPALLLLAGLAVAVAARRRVTP